MYSTLCGKGQKAILAKTSDWGYNEGQVILELLLSKDKKEQVLRQCGEKRTLVYSWQGCKLLQSYGKRYGDYSKN